MLNPYELLQELVAEVITEKEDEGMVNPSITLMALSGYLNRLHTAVDMRNKSLSYISGSPFPLPDFPRVFDEGWEVQ